MSTVEKSICEDLLKEGTVLNVDRFTCEGINVECFSIEYLNETYTMTRHDGEWVYFHHNIKAKGGN